MPSSLTTNEFDYLQVPHHGADVGPPTFRPKTCILNPSSKCKFAIAFVAVSDKNRHKHPKYKEHLDILESNGYRIHRTDKNGGVSVDI
jgi:beta-lactamase superfamily II metal-dependent hydrolase